MSITRLTGLVGVTVWGAAAALAAWERVRVPDAAAHEPARGVGTVSVVVPARNEERAVGNTVRTLRAQSYDDIQVVVVDDGSSDRTVQVARAAAADDSRVRVITAGDVPEAWIGKAWACHRGARESTGQWLLFTDADIEYSPDAIARALGLALRLGRGGVTLAPRVRTGSAAERAVMPAAIALIHTLVAPGPLARSPRSRVGLAAGAFILVDRDLYEAAGGHAGVRDRMVDDLSLAVNIKRAGGLLVPANGTSLISLRMYHGAREMWRGWRKNAAFAREGRASKGVVGGLILAGVTLAPACALARGTARRDGYAMALGISGMALQMMLQRSANRIVPTRPVWAPTFPVGAVVISAAAVLGGIERLAGRGPAWRGRRYPFAR